MSGRQINKRVCCFAEPHLPPPPPRLSQLWQHTRSFQPRRSAYPACLSYIATPLVVNAAPACVLLRRERERKEVTARNLHHTRKKRKKRRKIKKREPVAINALQWCFWVDRGGVINSAPLSRLFFPFFYFFTPGPALSGH